MKQRTAQDLLAERRANVQEMRRERDKMAKAMLRWHIATIDNELRERQQHGRDAAGRNGR